MNATPSESMLGSSSAERDVRNEVIADLLRRAAGHRRVCTITLAAACAVFLIGVALTFGWTPQSQLDPSTSDVALRGLTLAATYYLAISLLTVYRYNIRLSCFFFSRACSLRLVSAADVLTIESVASFLDTSSVAMDETPKWISQR